MLINILRKKIELNKTIVINLFSVALTQGISFFSMPIFTRVLGTEQYGLYSIFVTWASILTILMPMGIGQSISSGNNHFKNDYINFRNNIIFFSLISSIISILFFLLLYKNINLIIGYDFKLFVVLLFTAFANCMIGLITSILIFEKKALLNFVLSFMLSILSILLSLALIYSGFFYDLYLGRVYGHLLIYLFISIFLIVYIFFKNKIHINFKYLKYGFFVGSPIIFHQLAYIVLNQSDRIMMQKMNISSSDIGIYSFYYSFCSIIAIILSAFNTSFVPFYFDYIENNDYKNIIKKNTNFTELFTVICIGFLLLSREVSILVSGKDFISGINLIPILVGSTYCIFVYQFAVNYEFFYRKTKYIAFGTICTAIINIVLNLYFIYKFKMLGAAYATLISYIFLVVFHYIIAAHFKEMRFYFNVKSFIVGTLSVIFFSYIYYKFKSYVYIRWILGILIGIVEIYRIFKRKSIF